MKVSVLRMKEFGEVAEIKQDIVKIVGFRNCMNGQKITFGSGVDGVVVGFDHDYVLALALSGAQTIRPGDRATSQIEPFTVPVGAAFVGRRVSGLAEPADGKGPIKSDTRYPIFGEAPSVLERVPVREVMHTGIKIIDMMIPLGRGQRELIIGDRMTGKTTITTDAILSQRGKDVICIYCCIGKAESSLNRVLEIFEENKAFEYTIVVDATASTTMGQQYLAPYVAASMGQFFMHEQGRHVLVVFDDLTKHAWVYRQISLLLDRSPGRDAYPGDIFYLHSQLVERAGKLRPEGGGGSMTFLPIVETLQGDVARYIPSNLISMTDGQIYTSAVLFGEGSKPAIDPGLSVSRIGNKVQWPAMRQLAGMLRLEYVRYKELERLTKVKAGVSGEVERRLNKGRVVAEILKQDRCEPVPLEDQVMVLYALANGFMESLSPAEAATYQRQVVRFIRAQRPELVQELVDRKELTETIREGLNEQLARFAHVDG